MAPSGRPVALGKTGSSGPAFAGGNFSKHDQFLRNRDLSLLPVLRMKSPVRFGGDTHGHVLEIDITPGDEASFRVAKS